MKGALAAAAELVHAKCAVTSGCLADGLGSSITIGSATGYLWYGYPIESGRANLLGIQEFVNFSGFTYSDAGNVVYFDKDGAPTPSGCRVTYQYYASHTPPAITTTTTGC